MFWRYALTLIAVSAPALRAGAATAPAPAYAQSSVVNAASGVAGALAPNGLATVYGLHLSYQTRAISPTDLASGLLPTSLGGVSVYLGGVLANVFFVSPNQVNFLIPPIFRAGPVKLLVMREGVAGPEITIRLRDAAPGLFQMDPTTVIATRADGSLVSRETPAKPGEMVVLYATGLGRTLPDAEYRQIPTAAAQILRPEDLEISFNDRSLDPSRLAYAGLAPGFAGLYQVNLRLPESLPANPEIRLRLGEITSPAGLTLPVR